MNKKVTTFFAEYSLVPVIVLFFAVLPYGSKADMLTVFFSGALLTTVSVGICKLIKLLVRKERPQRSVEYFKSYETYGFPSTHSVGVTSLSFFVYMEKPILGVIAFFFAGITAYARVRAHVHDYYDIFAGIFLGALLGYFLYEPSYAYGRYLVEIFL